MPRTARAPKTVTNDQGYDPLMSPTGATTEKVKDVQPKVNPLEVFLNFTGSKLVVITPNIAQYVLENCNTLNRPLNKKRVAVIASAIKSGEWQVNGETIIFSKTKRLLDGQYRLSAIVAAQKEIETYVTTDVDEDAFETIDTGKTRTGSHVLSIKRTKNSFSTAATLNKINRFNTKNYDFDGAGVLTNRNLVHLSTQHPDVARSVERFVKYPRGVSKSTLAFCHYILNKIDATASEVLFAHLAEEAPTVPIIAVLKKHIMKGKSGRTHRLKQTAVIGSIFKTWNAMRTNTQTDDVSVHVAEEFPIPA